MRHINKRNKNTRKTAHRIVKKFVDTAWSEQEGRYVNFDYQTFRSSGFSESRSFKRLLLREQKGYCCYCMRHLIMGNGGRDNITYEHVIPHKVKKTDCAYYYARIPFSKRYIKVIDSTPSERCQVKPYPHFCAYENLVLSCDGNLVQIGQSRTQRGGRLHLTCNNKRGNERIEPIFFYHLPPLEWRYEYDGRITCSERFDDTVRILGLNNRTLILIRKAWATIDKSIKVENIREAIGDKCKRREIISKMDLSLREQQNLNNDLFWETFCEYDWFNQYFQSAK